MHIFSSNDVFITGQIGKKYQELATLKLMMTTATLILWLVIDSLMCDITKKKV